MSNQKCPVAAFTIAWGDNARKEARMCEASFRYWHPEIPFICLDEDDYLNLTWGKPPVWSGEIVSSRALAACFLARHVERVICLDADLFTLGRLDELIHANHPTVWAADFSGYTMGAPELPRINSGVVASSDPSFWQTWMSAQYGCLVPAINQFYFDQITLRILAHAGLVKGRMIDGEPGHPYYNIGIQEQPGDWRVLDGKVYKGAERALIYHQAGYKKRGISEAPAALQPWLEELTRTMPEGPQVDPSAWWREDGAAFKAELKERFQRAPTIVMDTIQAQYYERTPNQFRTVTPTAIDRHRNLSETDLSRIWNPKWQAYLYYQRDAGPIKEAA